MKPLAPALLLLLIPLLATAQTPQRCKVGLDVDVLWEGYWFPATIIDIDGDECLIDYDDFGDDYNEWVGLDSIRFIEKEYELAAGTKVEIFWNEDGEWYRAEVLKSRGARYFIHYDGWSSQWDEWVGRDRLRFPE